MRLKAACICSHDAPALAAFYARLFGCEPFVDGGVDYQFAREQLTIFQLGEAAEADTRGLALVYAVEDADETHRRLCALGLCGGAGPVDRPWGVRSFMIEDAQGNTISFAQPVEL